MFSVYTTQLVRLFCLFRSSRDHHLFAVVPLPLLRQRESASATNHSSIFELTSTQRHFVYNYNTESDDGYWRRCLLYYGPTVVSRPRLQ